MALVRIKSIHRVTKTLKDGKKIEYHYLSRGGPQFWKSDTKIPVNGPAYFKAYQEKLKTYKPSHGKFRQVIIEYTNSKDFTDLATATQDQMRGYLYHPDWGIDANFGSAPIASFSKPAIRRIVYNWKDKRAESSTSVADAMQGTLTTIVSWAIDRNYFTVNHLLNMKKVHRQQNRAELLWTDEEQKQFIKTAIEAKRPHIAIAFQIACETGLRGSDLALLNKDHIKKREDGELFFSLITKKKGRRVFIPISKSTSRYINNMPEDQHYLILNMYGKPTTIRNISKWILETRRLAGIREEIHLHDCRGTCATRLYRLNFSFKEIAAHMGWSIDYTSRMLKIYADANPLNDESLFRNHESI